MVEIKTLENTLLLLWWVSYNLLCSEMDILCVLEFIFASFFPAEKCDG